MTANVTSKLKQKLSETGSCIYAFTQSRKIPSWQQVGLLCCNYQYQYQVQDCHAIHSHKHTKTLMTLTALHTRLGNDLYCVEWDVKP